MTPETKPTVIQRIGSVLADEAYRFFFVFAPKDIEKLKQAEQERLSTTGSLDGNSPLEQYPLANRFRADSIGSAVKGIGINILARLDNLLPDPRGERN